MIIINNSGGWMGLEKQCRWFLSTYVKLNTTLFSFFQQTGTYFLYNLIQENYETMEFKNFNYINASKKFCNHSHYICFYYRHTHYGISQRQHIFRVYVIHSNCVRLHNFFFFTMDYDENGYIQI